MVDINSYVSTSAITPTFIEKFTVYSGIYLFTFLYWSNSKYCTFSSAIYLRFIQYFKLLVCILSQFIVATFLMGFNMMNDGCLAEINNGEISNARLHRTFTVIYKITTFIVEFTVMLTFIHLLLSIGQIIWITHSVHSAIYRSFIIL